MLKEKCAGTRKLNPRAAALLIALALTAYPKNWDNFFTLEELLEDVHDKNVQKEMEKGNETLRKEHDELEKPLKEAGIISGKDKKHSKEKNETREYRKPGGEEQLQKDFDKLPGSTSKAKDGIDIRTLPNGTTAIKRPRTDKQLPTLEIQTGKNDISSDAKVKIRYH